MSCSWCFWDFGVVFLLAFGVVFLVFVCSVAGVVGARERGSGDGDGGVLGQDDGVDRNKWETGDDGHGSVVGSSVGCCKWQFHCVFQDSLRSPSSSLSPHFQFLGIVRLFHFLSFLLFSKISASISFSLDPLRQKSALSLQLVVWFLRQRM